MKKTGFIFSVISTSFCVIVILSNVFSTKMVVLPWIKLCVPTGLMIYPLTFLISDLVTEIFGAKRARLMIYMAIGMNLLSLGIIQIVLHLAAKMAEEQLVFQTVLSFCSIRFFSSLTAYAVSQVVDVQLYAAIKRWTGSKWLWLRNNGSTAISQLIDTIIIDLLFLWWGLGMSITDVFPVMLFSYLYKAIFSFVCTPLFYLLVFLIRDKWRAALYTNPFKPKECHEF